MSKVGIQLKIDVSKIDKGLLYKGSKGVYLDATVFVELDQADQYGNNGMITQNETKENRDAGKNGAILGNCKVFWKGQPHPQSRPAQQHSNHGRQVAPQTMADPFDDDSLPF